MLIYIKTQTLPLLIHLILTKNLKINHKFNGGDVWNVLKPAQKHVCFSYFLPMKFSQKFRKNMFSEIWLILKDLIINQCKTTQMYIFLSFWMFPYVRNVSKMPKIAFSPMCMCQTCL